mmetsp:Transcript_21511/g.54182  ORF Transcript_21511/g.54182 Transcript_21511/m.54182 type:complete len:211 (-) Transcript_21511:265-897(-)
MRCGAGTICPSPPFAPSILTVTTCCASRSSRLLCITAWAAVRSASTSSGTRWWATTARSHNETRRYGPSLQQRRSAPSRLSTGSSSQKSTRCSRKRKPAWPASGKRETQQVAAKLRRQDRVALAAAQTIREGRTKELRQLKGAAATGQGQRARRLAARALERRKGRLETLLAPYPKLPNPKLGIVTRITRNFEPRRSAPWCRCMCAKNRR